MPRLENGVANWDCAAALDFDTMIKDIQRIKNESKYDMLLVEGHLLFCHTQLVAHFDELILLDLGLETMVARREGRVYPCSDGSMFIDPPGYLEQVVFAAHVQINRRFAEENREKVLVIDSDKNDLQKVFAMILPLFFG